MSKFLKEHEKVFASIKEVKYLLFENANNPFLVVSFAGYVPIKPTYAYGMALESIHCNKLFILDNFGFEQKGCWYLCENLNFSVEFSIIDLIKSVQRRLGICNDKVILIGSSMGGWAALYYGLKYNFGYVIAGGAQVSLGSHIKNNVFMDRKVLSTMVGDVTDEKITFLNNLIPKNIIPNDRIKIFLHYGLGDTHLEKHGKILCELAENIVPYVFLDVQIYGGHSDVYIYFHNYLRLTINNILSGNSLQLSDKKPYSLILKDLFNQISTQAKVQSDNNGNMIITLPVKLNNMHYALYLLDRNNVPLYKTAYQSEENFVITNLDNSKITYLLFYFKNSIGEIRYVQVPLRPGVQL